MTVRMVTDRGRGVTRGPPGESRYRALFARAGDALLVTDDDGRFIDANPAACLLLATSHGEIVGRSMGDFVEPVEDPSDVAIGPAPTAARTGSPADIRIRRPDGSVREVHLVATSTFAAGEHLAILHDDTDCLIDRGALLDASAALRLSEARFRAALDEIGMYAIILDTDGRLLFVNRHLKTRIDRTDAELVGANVFDFLAADDGPMVTLEAWDAGMTGGDGFLDHIESTWLTRAGDGVRVAWTNSAIRDDTGAIVAVASVGEDVTARRVAEESQAQLVAAIGQAEESIVVTDIAGNAIYANPAFERISGIAIARVIGRRPEMVLTDPGGRTGDRRRARGFRSGRPWRAERELRRPDGSVYREEVTTSPVRDPDGAIVNFVRVARDVTHLREVQASLDRTVRGRRDFARTLTRLRQRDTPEETAQEILDAVIELPGIDIGLLVSFEDPDAARLLAVSAPANLWLDVGVAIPSATAGYLRGRAGSGPWSDGREQRSVAGADAPMWEALGLRHLAYAPIVQDDHAIGLVILGTTDTRAPRRVDDHVAVAVEFAAAARSLIAEPLVTRQSLRVSRRRIESVIETRRFSPVFQPIVDLASGAAVGFEGLTRFADGSRPDLEFEDARRAGVGVALEGATLEATVTASRGLPIGSWLALNVSADFVLGGSRLARILERRTRPIVLEITEHDPIADYAAVRAAIAALGADVRIAVDDAGVGVANFGHIVELRPDIVKIDVSLVRDVNYDLTRQALIVGLLHFAKATHGWVVAEGVETEAERQTLIGLGLTFGQGYLFGRPAPVATWPSLAGRSKGDGHR